MSREASQPLEPSRFSGCLPETWCPCVPTDPMNALQSLTGGPAAGAAGIGMPPRGPGQSLGGMGSLGAMGQPMPLSGQPPPGTSGMAPHGMAVVSTAAPQSEYHASQGTCPFADHAHFIPLLRMV